MFGLVRSAIGALLVGLVVYAALFVDLGGKTFAGHLVDVWKSPVVQQKVGLVRQEVHRSVEEKLTEAGAQMGRSAAKQAVGAPQDDYSKADREALSGLIGSLPQSTTQQP